MVTENSEEHKAGWRGPWEAPHCWGINLGPQHRGNRGLPRYGNRPPKSKKATEETHTKTNTPTVLSQHLAGLCDDKLGHTHTHTHTHTERTRRAPSSSKAQDTNIAHLDKPFYSHQQAQGRSSDHSIAMEKFEIRNCNAIATPTVLTGTEWRHSPSTECA